MGFKTGVPGGESCKKSPPAECAANGVYTPLVNISKAWALQHGCMFVVEIHQGPHVLLVLAIGPAAGDRQSARKPVLPAMQDPLERDRCERRQLQALARDPAHGRMSCWIFRPIASSLMESIAWQWPVKAQGPFFGKWIPPRGWNPQGAIGQPPASRLPLFP